MTNAEIIYLTIGTAAIIGGVFCWIQDQIEKKRGTQK